MENSPSRFWEEVLICDGCSFEDGSKLANLYLQLNDAGQVILDGERPKVLENRELAEAANAAGLKTKHGKQWEQANAQRVAMAELARKLVSYGLERGLVSKLDPKALDQRAGNLLREYLRQREAKQEEPRWRPKRRRDGKVPARTQKWLKTPASEWRKFNRE